MSNNELNHAGIKGMKWGIRRYQNKDGSLTPLGKKRYGVVDDDKSDSKSSAKPPQDAKTKAMTSGNIKDVAANRHNMTNDELRKALDRVDLEQRLKDTDAKVHKSGFDKTISVIDKIDKARNAGEKLVSTYNLIAKINNSFNSRKMLEIDGKGKSDFDEYKDTLLKTADADGILRNIGKFKSNELNDAANILRNKETIERYTTEGKAKQQREEEQKRIDEATARATKEAARQTAENNKAKAEADRKTAEANQKTAEANQRKAEAEAKEAEARQAKAEAELKKEKEKDK